MNKEQGQDKIKEDNNGKKKYYAVCLPKALLEEVEKTVDANPARYRSMADFVREAVKEKIWISK